MSYRDRVVVITGASRGLGHGLAESFAAHGVRLGLCSRTIAPSTTDQIITRPVDVSDASAVDAFCATIAETFGPIDLWINNAGVLDPIGPMRDISESDFARHISINVLGVFHGSRAFVRHIHDHRHKAVLINISSGAARHAYNGWSAYCAGKAAVDRFSECVALEEAELGLRVHAVAPGIIDTDMQTLIREQPTSIFPDVGKFLLLKQEEGFSSPGFVAKHILDLAFETPSDEVLVSFPLEI